MTHLKAIVKPINHRFKRKKKGPWPKTYEAKSYLNDCPERANLNRTELWPIYVPWKKNKLNTPIDTFLFTCRRQKSTHEIFAGRSWAFFPNFEMLNLNILKAPRAFLFFKLRTRLCAQFSKIKMVSQLNSTNIKISALHDEILCTYLSLKSFARPHLVNFISLNQPYNNSFWENDHKTLCYRLNTIYPKWFRVPMMFLSWKRCYLESRSLVINTVLFSKKELKDIFRSSRMTRDPYGCI